MLPRSHAIDSWSDSDKLRDAANVAMQKGTLSGDTLHPQLGDVVVFNARLIHRAIPKPFANFERTFSGKHRVLITLNYGRNNGFTDAFDRGYSLRNKALNEQGFCPPSRVGALGAKNPAVHDKLPSPYRSGACRYAQSPVEDSRDANARGLDTHNAARPSHLSRHLGPAMPLHQSFKWYCG